jgi:lipoprotein-anchoring transpeptidase ErfK/SrfK
MVRAGVKISFLFILSVNTALYGVEKEIIIDLSEQRAYAYEDGYLVLEGRISSGVIGRETPNGEFRILEKKRYHRSNLWPKPNGGAKMNYMLRLTNTGIAVHLGPVPNRPASHGCIRMKNGFAQKMFKWAEVGVPVYVEGDAEEYLYFHQPVSTKGGWHYADEYGVIDYHD